MPREISLFGLLMPTLVPLFFLCIVFMWQIDRLFHHFHLYSLVYHPALVRIAVFTIIFCAAGLFIYG